MSERKNELAVINKESFLKKFEPTSMITEYKGIKSLAEAVESDTNGISYYSKHIGEDTVMAVIELHLLALSTAVNVSQKLSKIQIKEIAIEIMSMYFHLSIVEVSYVFRKAKRGEFGKFYNSISIVDVLSWFAEYAEERAQHFINEQISSHSHFRDDSMRSEDRRDWEKNKRLNNNK